MRRVAKDAYAALRLPSELKLEVERIADAEVRPLSSTLELLIRRGLAAYRQDGLLIDVASKNSIATAKSPPDPDQVNLLADKIAERLLGRFEPPRKGRSPFPGKKGRAA